MSEKIVYLMRGLPSCGKSYTAQRLAGSTGVICETDEYFYTQVGDDRQRFDYRQELMETARRWNFNRYCLAIDRGASPVIVDRGNSRCLDTQRYIMYAINRGYRVELKEPESEIWQELRVLLKYKDVTRPILDDWAERLAKMNRSTHRTPASLIRRWMDKWRHDLTIDDIVNFRPKKKAS